MSTTATIKKYFMMVTLFSVTSYLIVEHFLRYSFRVGPQTQDTIYLVNGPEQSGIIDSNQLQRRRVLFFAYCRHYHDFDARFAQYSIETLPNSEFYTMNLDELNLNKDMQQLNAYAVRTYNLTPNIDKWQWTLWPTCGQYKNNLYLTQRNTIKKSKVYFNNAQQSLSKWSSAFNALYRAPYIQYPQNNAIINTWHHDVFWPDTAHTIPLSHPSRPLIVAMSGEVFWEADYGSGENIDFELMRSRAYPKTRAFTGHWLQSAKGFYRRSYNRDDRNLALLETEYQNRNAQTWDAIYANKTEFCVMIVKSIYQRGKYFPDALVRHVTFRMLSQQYKQCHSRGQSYVFPDTITRCASELGDIGTFICMKPYKFAITMENTLKAGYMSEKIFNGIFADTVPIYFGLPDIEEYNINMDRFVYCNVSEDKILQMRKMQKQHGKIWLFDEDNMNPTDEELIEWALVQLKDELQPCVDEIINLDKNKELYMRKVKQSIFKTGTTKRSQFDGYTLGVGFGELLKTLRSYLFEDLFSKR
eukprot:1078384_1